MLMARYLQLDVFTSRAGLGNPLGVVIDAQQWSSDDMQRFARWTDLVETTFLLPAESPQATYRLRIFTPQREIPFAGHPSVGSAHAALLAGVVEEGAPIIQECGAGLLPIMVKGAQATREIFVQAPNAKVLLQGPNPAIDAVLRGQSLGSLPPAFVEGGRRWWLVELASEADLRGWKPDHAQIAELAGATDSLGLCVFARSVDPDFDLVVRAFPAGVGIIEDPASGAANGLIAAYIAQSEPHGQLALGYRVSQGREVGRDACLSVVIEADAVWVGGRTCTVIDGLVSWPAASAADR
jgi:PhzF family phenazine biosynthesis protein